MLAVSRRAEEPYRGRIRWLGTAIFLFVAACSESFTGPEAVLPEGERDPGPPALVTGSGPQATAGYSSERQMLVNRTHVSPWAYHTTSAAVRQDERWYISRIRRNLPGDTYSLGPIQNGQAAWWTIGTEIAAFNSLLSSISFPAQLDTDPSDTFWDIGLGRPVTNPRIHSDRRGLEGRTTPVKWYFFQAANGGWYIVNATGYGAVVTVLRFASKGNDYDWQPVDMSGVTATFSPASDGNGMRITLTERPMPVISSLVWHVAGQATLVQVAQYNSNAPIDPTRRTWVLVHGRLNGPGDMYSVAAAIRERLPSDQILMLNWEDAARVTAGYVAFSNGEQWIEPVGRWVAGMLRHQGFAGTTLNLVGHSWGSYVADEMAEAMGRVNLTIALDPAANTIGSAFNPNDAGTIDFGKHARHSVAFHSSRGLGNEETPGTAREAFVVAFVPVSGVVTEPNRHRWVRDLFAALVRGTGGVSTLFALERLIAGEAGPWLADRYRPSDGEVNIIPGPRVYEGVIWSRLGSRDPGKISYVNLAGVEVTIVE